MPRDKTKDPANNPVPCGNCKASNPSNFTFCFSCLVPRKGAPKPKAKPAKATTRKK